MDVEDENRPRASVRHQLAHDKGSLLLLLFLYMLQGIPLGLAGSVPMLLQAKHIGYRQQAMFSLVSWPFSVKLLWAPIVDSVFSSTFGRRKTWLVPTQYALGVTMILLSFIVDTLMGEGGVPPNVLFLTVLFFFLHFLAATQDIAVDGWALTMLSRENVGYASTCNSVGQTAGFFLGYTVFLALGSADFCNAYLRLLPQETGILDLPTFLFFWGIVFIVMTTGIWWLKKESSTEQMATTPVVSGYLKLLSCLKLSSVQELALAVLTSKASPAHRCEWPRPSHLLHYSPGRGTRNLFRWGGREPRMEQGREGGSLGWSEGGREPTHNSDSGKAGKVYRQAGYCREGEGTLLF